MIAAQSSCLTTRDPDHIIVFPGPAMVPDSNRQPRLSKLVFPLRTSALRRVVFVKFANGRLAIASDDAPVARVCVLLASHTVKIQK